MPTTKSKDSFYFSHDSNARNDIKIIKLRRKHGMTGYGIYWCIIEILREHGSHKIPISDIDDIAFQIGESMEIINDVIKSFGLFEITDNEFYSPRLLRSMNQYQDMKDKLSKAGQKGMQNRWKNEGGAPPLKKVSP